MITKGIIKSINLTGNTCVVRMPLFETAGNDEISGTATISNTPGSYNGYKEGDIVWVAFEDGSMDTPVVIGKLYLGVEKEKADPRGVINVVDSAVSNSAIIPADSKLGSTKDKNIADTVTPYTSLVSMADSINTAGGAIAKLWQDLGDKYEMTMKKILETGEEFESRLTEEADKISAEVKKKVPKYSKDDEDGSEESFGWALEYNNWRVYNKMTLGENEVPDRDNVVLSVKTVQKSTMGTYFFTNNRNVQWPAVYYYAYNTNTGARNADWPGLTAVFDHYNDYGEPVHKVTLDRALYDVVVFNGGNLQTKTVDLYINDMPEAKNAWYPASSTYIDGKVVWICDYWKQPTNQPNSKGYVDLITINGELTNPERAATDVPNGQWSQLGVKYDRSTKHWFWTDTTGWWAEHPDTGILANTERNILKADKNGLTVSGTVYADMGELGSFIIGKRHQCTALGGANRDAYASGLYSAGYMDLLGEQIYSYEQEPVEGAVGVYVGTDGIRLGDKFKVNHLGQLTTQDASIQGTIATGIISQCDIYEHYIFETDPQMQFNNTTNNEGFIGEWKRRFGDNCALTIEDLNAVNWNSIGGMWGKSDYFIDLKEISSGIYDNFYEKHVAHTTTANILYASDKTNVIINNGIDINIKAIDSSGYTLDWWKTDTTLANVVEKMSTDVRTHRANNPKQKNIVNSNISLFSGGPDGYYSIGDSAIEGNFSVDSGREWNMLFSEENNTLDAWEAISGTNIINRSRLDEDKRVSELNIGNFTQTTLFSPTIFSPHLANTRDIVFANGVIFQSTFADQSFTGDHSNVVPVWQFIPIRLNIKKPHLEIQAVGNKFIFKLVVAISGYNPYSSDTDGIRYLGATGTDALYFRKSQYAGISTNFLATGSNYVYISGISEYQLANNIVNIGATNKIPWKIRLNSSDLVYQREQKFEKTVLVLSAEEYNRLQTAGTLPYFSVAKNYMVIPSKYTESSEGQSGYWGSWSTLKGNSCTYTKEIFYDDTWITGYYVSTQRVTRGHNTEGGYYASGTFYPGHIVSYNSTSYPKLSIRSESGSINFATNIYFDSTGNGTGLVRDTANKCMVLAGNWSMPNGNAVTSDIRYKEDTKKISEQDKYSIFFDNLVPRTFKYKDGTSDRQHIGFVAQEVKKALTAADLTTKDFGGFVAFGDPDDFDSKLGLRYHEFVSLNTSEIQKLKKRVSQLENELAEIKKIIKKA